MQYIHTVGIYDNNDSTLQLRQDHENKTKSFRRTTEEISLVLRVQHIFAFTSKILIASALETTSLISDIFVKC